MRRLCLLLGLFYRGESIHKAIHREWLEERDSKRLRLGSGSRES